MIKNVRADAKYFFKWERFEKHISESVCKTMTSKIKNRKLNSNFEDQNHWLRFFNTKKIYVLQFLLDSWKINLRRNLTDLSLIKARKERSTNGSLRLNTYSIKYEINLWNQWKVLSSSISTENNLLTFIF
jgi:hypothetical protein